MNDQVFTVSKNISATSVSQVNNSSKPEAIIVANFSTKNGFDKGVDVVGNGVCNEGFNPNTDTQTTISLGWNLQNSRTGKQGIDKKEIRDYSQNVSHGDGETSGRSSYPIQGMRVSLDLGVASSDYEIENCGMGAFQPLCLQKCKTIGSFTVLYGISSIMSSACTTYITSQITTLEKHFNFSSSVSGILLSCTDFGYFLMVLVFSHLSRRINIPKGLAMSSFVYGVSGILCTIPYFGTRYIFDNQNTFSNIDNVSVEFSSHLCERDSPTHTAHSFDDDNNNVTSCDASSRGVTSGGLHGLPEQWRSMAIGILGIALVLQGVAKSPCNAFTGTYIDDNGPKTKSSLYIAIIIGLTILGPALAYILGGIFSSVYITLEDTQLAPNDPRWLGAWWLGFLFFGIFAFVMGIPLLFFPRRLMIKQEIVDVENKRKIKAEHHNNNKVFHEIRGFMKSVLKLALNPIFVLVNIGTSMNLMGISGLMAFLPKYLEVNFNVPTWKVNIVLGALNICGASIGALLGGVITSRWKMSPIACLKMIMIVKLITIPYLISTFFLTCEQPSFDHRNANSSCSTDCNCNMDAFFPICGEDNLNYFSPCHAGCTSLGDGGGTFENCSCLSSGHYMTARGGLCDSGCTTRFWIFCVGDFLSSVFETMAFSPGFIIMVRSVTEELKPTALGVSSFLTSLLGWFPGPIIFGKLIDATCIISQTTSCGESIKGACQLYNLADFRNNFNGLITGLRIFSILFVFIAFLTATMSSKPLFQPHKDTRDEKEVTTKEIKLGPE